MSQTQDSRLKTQDGFTLIEIMVSISILSIGLVSIMQGFSGALNVLRISENNLKASLIAENKFAQAQIAAIEKPDDFPGGLNEDFKLDNLEFAWEVEASSVSDLENLNKIDSSLAWKEGKREGVVLLATFMRKGSSEFMGK